MIRVTVSILYNFIGALEVELGVDKEEEEIKMQFNSVLKVIPPF